MLSDEADIVFSILSTGTTWGFERLKLQGQQTDEGGLVEETALCRNTSQVLKIIAGNLEIQIHLVPVLLGEGIRLFEHLGTLPIELESTRVIEAPGVTHLWFRVVKDGGNRP